MMMKMRTSSRQSLRVIVSLLSCLTLSGQLSAAFGAALPAEAQSALKLYLGQDCTVEEEPTALQKVVAINRQYQGALEPVLINYLAQGPDKDEIEAARQALEAQWKRREESLKSQPKLAMSERQMRGLQAITQEAYVNNGINQLIQGYRQKSAIALASIGTPRTEAALAEASKIGDPTLKDVINATAEQQKSTAATQGQRRRPVSEQ
jgi:hypothetical protein